MLYVNGVAVPMPVAVTVPVLKPQVASVFVNVNVGPLEFKMFMDVEPLQPFTSLTVNV
jgi:hypothetical protein